MAVRYSAYGSPRHPARDTPSGAAGGRTIRQRVRETLVVVRDAEPVGTAMMASLGIASDTRSPMSNNNGGVSMNIGAGITGRDARRTGALQNWLGLHRPVNNPRTSNVNIQAGPSSQPAYPSTGSNAVPGLQSMLAGMSLPQVLTNPAVTTR
jgi:hypothetical protein